jgi:hypothetical protein
MLDLMVKHALIVSALVLLLPLPVNAQLYKGLDEEGNVVYSDKPFHNAEKLTPPPLSVMDAPKAAAKPEAAEEEAKPVETSYSSFAIKSPSNDETLWNQPDVIITMDLEPKLAIQEGHTITLLVDGRPVVTKSGSPTVHAGRLNRGSHTLQGRVLNRDGRTIKQTPSVKVHVKQTSVLN